MKKEYDINLKSIWLLVYSIYLYQNPFYSKDESEDGNEDVTEEDVGDEDQTQGKKYK